MLKADVRIRITHRARVAGCEPGTVGTILATLDVNQPANNAVGSWSRPYSITHFYPNERGPSAIERKADVWISCLPPANQPQGWGPRNCL